jgi:hypothetical protein
MGEFIVTKLYLLICNMWFVSALIMMVYIESFYRQHTRRYDWETFEGHEEFLDQV